MRSLILRFLLELDEQARADRHVGFLFLALTHQVAQSNALVDGAIVLHYYFGDWLSYLMFFDIITDNEKLLWIEPPQHLVTPEMPSLYMKLYKDRTKYNFIWFVKNKDVDQLIALTCK